MSPSIDGLHHVTAIASDPQRNLDFYVGILGLRLVKRTVNFDDPSTYHFYYGDSLGRPGTILTFFPWPLARRGTHGSGQTTATALAVPNGSLTTWHRHLVDHGVEVGETSREKLEAAEGRLTLRDPDGMTLELHAVASPAESQAAEGAPAIVGLHGATVTLQESAETERLLSEVFGFERREGAGLVRYRSRPDAGLAATLELRTTPDLPPGRISAGSVHHIAWRVPDREALDAWRRRVTEAGLFATEVLDRRYFESIYFREPGGVLFELATEGPGFDRDEAPAELGRALQLPPWLEERRSEIERRLPEIRLPG